MPIVDFRIPAAVGAQSVHTARSLASLSAIATSTLHLCGWRFRRVVTQQWTWADATFNGYSDVGAAGSTNTHRVRWTTSPLAEFLAVVLIYQAADEQSGGSDIALQLYDTAGASQDGPVTLDSEEGTLQTETLDVGRGLFSYPEYPHLTTHTGVVEDPPSVDRPRVLKVPSGVRGAAVELRVTTTSCRLRAATVWELPTPEVG